MSFLSSSSTTSSIRLTNFQLGILVFILSALVTLPFLHQFEFLRHTEADRTLIAYELLQTHAWFAPTLFGDLYLTKPPFYYWVVASFLALSSSLHEGVARLPSALSSCLLVLAFFIFLLRLGFSQSKCLLGAFCLLSSAEFLRYAAKAEMDMFYSLLCGLALFLGYFANTSSRFVLFSGGAGLFLGLAFLAKGPPVIVFFGSAVIGLFISQVVSKNLQFFNFLCRNLLIALVPLLLLGAWMYAMFESSVHSEDLVFQFREELIRRFLDDGEGEESGKPWWYYFLHIPVGLLPWTIFAALGSRKSSLSLLSASESEPERERHEKLPQHVVPYALGSVIISFFIFTLSSGKSTRYLLPLFPLFILLFLPSISSSWSRLATVVWRQNGENASNKLLLLFFLFLFIGKIAAAYLYAPIAHERRSAKPALAILQNTLGKEKNLYVLEVFERWLPFYFIREGGKVFRITPQRAHEWKDSSSDIFILLNREEEYWRLNQLESKLPGSILEKHEFSIYKDDYLLVRIPARCAWAFDPKKNFPTAPSSIPKEFR